MTSDEPSTTRHGFDPIAGLLAALLPGLGHLYQKKIGRAAAAAVGILGLFLGGMLIGGIDVVDSREDRWWFYGQALTGPLAIAANHVHQNQFKAYGPVRRPPDPDAEIFRSGYPDEQRVVGPDGRAIWRPLRESEIEAGMGPPNQKSLGKINEIGMLYAVIAGMLNLIVFLDALFPTIREENATESVSS